MVSPSSCWVSGSFGGCNRMVLKFDPAGSVPMGMLGPKKGWVDWDLGALCCRESSSHIAWGREGNVL